ncbi:hypothetical protein [Streptomyces sp. NPDC093591]|uniref:hypothetical protein n=1 Tax=Streptomyces sp. NPDC093591 TaxID=3366044 RepID=UPI003801FDD5
MRTVLVAAAGFPTLLFTAALVVVVVFWLLVAVGAAASDSFDADVDLDAWGMGGVPVAVAFSLLTGFAWLLSLGAAVLLGLAVPAGVLRILTCLLLPFGAVCVAWRLTGRCLRPLRRRLPDEPGPSPSGFAGQSDAGAGHVEMSAWDGSTAVVPLHRGGADRLPMGATGPLSVYEEIRGLRCDPGLDRRGHAA